MLVFLGNFHVQNNDYKKGIALLEQAMTRTERKPSFLLGFLGYAYGKSGDKDKAYGILNKCIERWNSGNFTPTTIADIYIGLDQKDKAFEWLNIAIKMRDPRLFCLKTAPVYKSMQTDPRWSELMKKMGLEG